MEHEPELKKAPEPESGGSPSPRRTGYYRGRGTRPRRPRRAPGGGYLGGSSRPDTPRWQALLRRHEELWQQAVKKSRLAQVYAFPQMDFKQQHARIIRFLQDEFSRWPGEGVVLPFYPSLETALCAIWSVEALGPERVHLAWHMSSGDQDLAEQLSSRLQCKLMPIQARPLGTLRLNSLAEQMLRHSQVVELAEKNHWVILGQASRTRLSLGLQTYHAIGAAAINPVAHLYQRQIVQMASSMAASESLFTQFLQRDLSRFEQGLKPGLTLEEVDLLLNWLLDHRLALAWLLEQGESEEKVLWLYQAMRQAVLEQAKPSAL